MSSYPAQCPRQYFKHRFSRWENSDNDTEAGSRAVRRRRVYIPVRDALRGATDTEEADTVELPDGLIYEVVDTFTWAQPYKSAFVLRES